MRPLDGDVAPAPACWCDPAVSMVLVAAARTRCARTWRWTKRSSAEGSSSRPTKYRQTHTYDACTSQPVHQPDTTEDTPARNKNYGSKAPVDDPLASARLPTRSKCAHLGPQLAVLERDVNLDRGARDEARGTHTRDKCDLAELASAHVQINRDFAARQRAQWHSITRRAAPAEARAPHKRSHTLVHPTRTLARCRRRVRGQLAYPPLRRRRSP